ncbi:efflux RND transporter periplasmic adaptor subunit [Paenibacillus caseinilyticus]|uniref:RND transporter n=1 Tax=Paenibacillus mucilaginosus K02 TaxID=997761 RepID=I0BLI1_9BACL|nr:HlyD family efflux transporter periplasmic adaptor subunit [Paenibacillus mucilaginosus]AFH63228.1 RND transporter [Paenibacillus mucilaginosus K02]
MPTKKNRKILRAAGIWGLVFMLAGCSLLPVEEQELQPPLVEPVKETLTIYEVKRSDIAKGITGDATFVSERMHYLHFTESGARLVALNVKLGDKVKAGDVIAETETSDLDDKIRLQEIAIEKIEIGLKQELQNKPADDPALRIKALDLESARIQMKSLQSQLKRSRLVAEVDGIVSYLDPIKPGDEVTAYEDIVTISDPRQMKLVYTAAGPNDLAGVQIGMDASVKIKDKTYPGKVVQTPMSAPPSGNKTADEINAKSVVLRVEGLPADTAIGSHADITIVTEQRAGVLVIPRAGLRSYMGRDYVQVMEGESRKEVDVEKGIVSATEVEIRKGVSEGQRIILDN